tara:strand:- start:691 stop:1149 length:459 start_codon:yes stop_codon:yes gene_type:complete
MKSLSVFLSFLLVMMPIYAHAETPSPDGRVTNLEKNGKAPYAGILLDPIAASKMLIDQKYLKLEVELSLRKQFHQDLSNKRLAFDLLKIEHDSLLKYHASSIKLKDQHITNLNQMLKDEIGSQHTHWWAIGGVALGIILSIGVFYASVEVAR